MMGMVRLILFSLIVAVAILNIGCGLHVVSLAAGGESSSHGLQYQYGAVNNADKITCDGGPNICTTSPIMSTGGSLV
eukprot:scaffold17343_cov39-Attheya_sp.AAC.1